MTWPSAHRRVTVIWFWVSVPVLSEQMVVVEPSVSTEESLRMRAWRLIIWLMPSARLMVTTAGRPSGTAAMARLTETMKASVISLANCFKVRQRVLEQEGQIRIVDHSNQEDHRHQDQGADAQGLAQFIQPALERSFFRFDALQHGGDQTQLGVHAGAGDHAAPAPVGDRGAHEGSILPVAQRGVAVQLDGGVLLHRQRFTGERGLFDPHVDGFQQAHIRRDKVARFEVDDVARHQFARRDADPLPIAQDLRFRGGHFLERRQGFLGAAFLDDPQDRS